MNLLESALCNCNAEEYSTNFKQFGIDAFTLKLLSDEDLKIIGIKEEEKRKALVEYAAKLQIPAENFAEMKIDDKYMCTVLAQISVHLQKHLAALLITSCREDVVVCDVRLSPATKCLADCVNTFKQQLDQFEHRFTSKHPSRSTSKQSNRKYKRIVVSGVAIILLGVLSLKLTPYLKRLT